MVKVDQLETIRSVQWVTETGITLHKKCCEITIASNVAGSGLSGRQT